MIRVYRTLAAGTLAACLLTPAGLLARDDTASQPWDRLPTCPDRLATCPTGILVSSETSQPEGKPAEATAPAKESAPPPAAKPPRDLSPALIALRDGVRRTLAAHQKQAFNTRENSATEIMNFCLAFGCSTEVSLEGPAGKRINGITSLCWNYPCAGFEMFGPSQGHIAARIGYGCQEQPGEFLAMLAMSRVQPDYPVRIGKDVRTVADLVEAEKLACRSGSDQSLKLVGLACYVAEPEWKNSLGEAWSLERIIEEELAQPVVSAPEGGLNRLLGLSYAVAHRTKHEQPIDGQFQRAAKYVADFHGFALKLQNADGSWGPYFLAARGTSPEAASQLRSTGRVLEWLAISLSDKELKDARVVNAVECVNRLLVSQHYLGGAPSLSTREIAAVGHALHALAVYDERVFKPADAAEKPAGQESSSASGAKPSKSR